MQYQDVTPAVVLHVLEMTDMIDFGEFPSLTLENPSAVT